MRIDDRWIQLASATELCPRRFAPAGRDVYSLAVLSLLLSSVRAQSSLPASANGFAAGFAPKGARSWVPARSYKHLAPLELKRSPLLQLQVDPPYEDFQHISEE